MSGGHTQAVEVPRRSLQQGSHAGQPRTFENGRHAQAGLLLHHIAPQHSGTFNTGGGAWNNLEDVIDKYWDATKNSSVGDTLYVVVGAYYKTWTDSYGNTASPKKAAFGGQQAGVPTMFYYAMLRTKNAKSGKSVLRCSREELQCAAFVMSHAMQKGHKPSRSDMRSVAEVERLSGFQFFTNVPNAPKDTYNPSDWGL